MASIHVCVLGTATVPRCAFMWVFRTEVQGLTESAAVLAYTPHLRR